MYTEHESIGEVSKEGWPLCSVSLLYRVSCVIGLLGSLLVSTGFFSPVRMTSLPGYPDAIDSFWTMLVDTITGGDRPLGIACATFLLTFLIPFLASLAGLLDDGKQVLHRLSSAFAILGLLELLMVSRFFLFSSFALYPHVVARTIVVGPGEWLMLSGFLVSIGSSIAQNVLFKPRETLIEPPAGWYQ